MWQATRSPTPPARRLGSVRGGDITGRQGGSFTEEILFHLLQEKLLCFGVAQVQTIFIHDHLHLLDPHPPRLLRDVFVNALAERVAVKRRFVQARHLLSEFHAEDRALNVWVIRRTGTHGILSFSNKPAPDAFLRRRVPS